MNIAAELTDTLNFDPEIELERLEDLQSLHLLDTPAEDRFDRVTRLAAEFFHVPMAYVAFMDTNRQWFKSRYGPCPTETTRAISFCQHTLRRDEPLIMEDAREHPLGRNHPMVKGEPYIRFYAGVPLTGPRGRKIGTFCLVGLEPRKFGPDQVEQLKTFATIVQREISLGQIIQTQNDLLSTRAELVQTQAKLDHQLADAAKYVRRMLPPPLVGGEILEWHFEPSAHLGGDGLGYRRIDQDRLAIYILDVTGHGMGSALMAVTALEFLRSREVRDTDFSKPAMVLGRLNRAFQMKEHAGKFFSAWYGVFSKSARTITYSNAGHPPPLMLTRDGLQKVPAGGPVLGVMRDLNLPENIIPFPPGAELYLFTDGLYELSDKRGHGSYDEFVTYLEQQAKLRRSVWPTILEWADQARRKGMVDDDVSLLRFTAPS